MRVALRQSGLRTHRGAHAGGSGGEAGAAGGVHRRRAEEAALRDAPRAHPLRGVGAAHKVHRVVDQVAADLDEQQRRKGRAHQVPRSVARPACFCQCAVRGRAQRVREILRELAKPVEATKAAVR
jgi:hypothetical protein